MKICMLSYSYYESDNRVRRYAESLVQRGSRVDVIAIRQKKHKRYEIIRGVHVYRIQCREKNEKSKFDYLFRILLFLFNSFIYLTWRHIKTPYDLIHVHSVPDFEVFAALIPRMLGTKVILDIHDIVPEFYAGKFNSGNGGFIYKLLIRVERLCCFFSHHVIISNDLWRELLISRSVDSKKCTTILNYPDSSIFKKPTEKKEYSEGPFILIYPGSLNYHQGLDIAVKAMHIVREKNDAIQFHIYGAGPLIPTLQTLTKEFKLENSVYLHDSLPLEEIAQKMALAHVGIVPKRADGFGNEAFSTKIFEFMILGIPVIASETKIDSYYFNDTLLEYFNPGDEISLADKILYLYNNPQRRGKLVESAISYATQNSWGNKKEIYFELVSDLCGTGSIPKLVSQEINT